MLILAAELGEASMQSLVSSELNS